ncbi:MAG TPA: hypothetical protein VGB53_11720 [Rubricoccaceae bacterium]|jgi:hypothetical protein
MNPERPPQDDQPAEQVAPPTRFFLAEPVSTTSRTADTAHTLHSYRVGNAPLLPNHDDLFTGRPVPGAPGTRTPAVFFTVSGLDAESQDLAADEEFTEYVSAEAVAFGPSGLREVATSALSRVESEICELEWRRKVIQGLLAADTVTSEWSEL